MNRKRLEEIIREKFKPPEDDVGFIADQVEALVQHMTSAIDARYLRQMTLLEIGIEWLVDNLGFPNHTLTRAETTKFLKDQAAKAKELA